MLYARTQGEGPALLLLHGLFGSLENLGALARPLSQHFTVYSLDLPNHGRSPHQHGLGLSAMADAVQQWIVTQGLGPIRVLGHSLGGKVAMEMALTWPELFAALIVVDIAPVQYVPHHQAVFAGLQSLDLAHLHSRSQADTLLAQQVAEPAVRSFLLKNLVKTDTGFVWRMNLSALVEDYPHLITANREGCYSGPTLFLKGGLSDYLRPEHRAAVESRFTQLQFKEVGGVGHWPHADKPDLVARLVLNFLLAQTINERV